MIELRVLEHGNAAPPGSLMVDGAGLGNGNANGNANGNGNGAAVVWSHWRNAPPTPQELQADTATGMALRAAHDPERWLREVRCVVNDHLDADGALAMVACAVPQLAAAHAGLLIAAAEAADFSVWTGAEGFRLMIAVHRMIAAHGNEAPHRIASALPELIAAARRGNPDDDASLRMIDRALNAIAARRGIDLSARHDLQILRWRAETRVQDAFNATQCDPSDAWPVWALSAAGPLRPQLLLMEARDGVRVWLDAPRYAWARTAIRPAYAMPDLSHIAAQLTASDTAAGTWFCGEAAQRFGFSCALAHGDSQSQALPSSLSAERIAAIVAQAWDTRA